MQSDALSNQEDTMFHVSRNALRSALVAAAVVVAVVVAASPASAKSTPAKCKPTPAHWVVANVDVAVPQFTLIPAVRCTAAVDNTAGSCAPGSPYPGWVQVTDDIGRPFLVPIGSEAAAASSCNRSQAQTTPKLPAPTYWVTQTDDLGVPWLVPVPSVAA
ncbi:MAG TPA: hypothetical protein VMB53_00455 [Gaiellaceae bacterium]|nr:hypothetical protein [Gaiellaceae bacterium]